MKYQKYRTAKKAADLISDCYGHYSAQAGIAEEFKRNLLDDLRDCAKESEFEYAELQHARSLFIELLDACGANLNEESPLDNPRMTEMKAVILLWQKESEARDEDQVNLNSAFAMVQKSITPPNTSRV